VLLRNCSLTHPLHASSAIMPSLSLLPGLGQSAPTRHLRTFYDCFPRLPQGFPLQAFLPMTFTTGLSCLHSDRCHFQTLKSFFYLLTHSKQKFYPLSTRVI